MEEFLACCFPLRDDQKPTVLIKCGKLMGRLREKEDGTDYVAFTSIPYAEPPLGKYCNNASCKLQINCH